MDSSSGVSSQGHFDEHRAHPRYPGHEHDLMGRHRREPHGVRSEGSMRRGHSDGDVSNNSRYSGSPPNFGFNSGLNPVGGYNATINQPPLDDRSGDVYTGPWGARERAELIMADRMRRLARHSDNHPRRRAVSNLYPGSGHIVPPPGFSQPNREEPIQPPLNPTFATAHRGDLNRPLPLPPDVQRGENNRSEELPIPQWQPDAEASSCPICHTAFSFWYRKHHCRKCGRVVCANCSPHRITIPRQFIVHPPEGSLEGLGADHDGQEAAAGSAGFDRHGSTPYGIDPALGGGQEVRLCNPCVPDPNPAPYPSYFPSRPSDLYMHAVRSGYRPPTGPNPYLDHALPPLPRRTSSHSSGHRLSPRHDFHGGSASPSSPNFSHHPSSSRRHSHGFHYPGGYGATQDQRSLYGSAPDHPHEARVDSLRHRHGVPNYSRHRQHASLSQLQSRPRGPWSRDWDSPRYRQPSQPFLKEEDECPVCHGALPPKGLDGSEDAREAHINACIEGHLLGTKPRPIEVQTSHASNAAGVAAGSSTDQSSSIGFTNNLHQASGMSSAWPLSSSVIQQRRRTVGMVVYQATEKDCVGENGEGEAECVICFEEFAVGDELGRLECLCKFHKTCIRQWWDTKGPGACPVHQQQEEV